MIRILDHRSATDLLTRRTARLREAEDTVRPILEAVRARGDAALLEFCRKFDGFEGSTVAIDPEACRSAWTRLDRKFRSAVEIAAQNIRDFAATQLPEERFIDYRDGRRLGQIVRPLDSMGAYIPGGRYPLPSTLLMTVIPAQVAGVKRITVACPRPGDEILGAAAYLEAPCVFQMGGAHAIAALAYGTKTVPRVDRIVGPGNVYVAAAKKMIAGEIGIDFVAGPTEIVIIATEGKAAVIAADMLAQAEHDVDASAMLLTTSRLFAEAVAAEIGRQLADLPTASVAGEAIARNGAIVLFEDPAHAVEFANQLAPEHLALHDPALLPAIRNAGSIFLGSGSPEAAGDYASGPNHVLPTSGAARLRGGLSAADFVKVISVQELSVEALARLAPAITTLARAEGLEAHARSVEIRVGRSGVDTSGQLRTERLRTE
jgi:histidinol dehydrogenase